MFRSRFPQTSSKALSTSCPLPCCHDFFPFKIGFLRRLPPHTWQVRPKLYLANDGNYRETRWFAGWKHAGRVVDLKLPDVITRKTGQKIAPFGDAALSFNDTMLGSETCEELFTPNAAHIPLALNGVEIISNGSGSHHEVSATRDAQPVKGR